MSFAQRLLASSLLRPLRIRDFRLLAFAAVVSLLGDGFYFVALSWQVYAISNLPSALAVVGLAGALPMVALLLLGGVLSDRYDRRRLMIGADLIRGAAIGVMAILALTGSIELWHIVLLSVAVSAGGAFFNPASTAIVPDLLDDAHLPAANALAGIYRPTVLRLLGPALAGVTVAAFGPGPAFAIDAASFLVTAAALAAIRTRPAARDATGASVRRTIAEVREGIAFARSQPWLWATLVSAMLSLLVFIGPVEVLVPFIVKNRLGLGPDSLGAIFAAGGVGSIVMAVLIGQLGQPRRRVTAMYAAWSLAVLAMAVYGLMTSLWQGLLAGAVVHAGFQLGQVIWTTLLQQLVPRRLLGRISSLDWLMSTGLVPLSFALTGPVAAVFGPEQTMVGAAVLGALFMGMLLFVPGVRDAERPPAAAGAAGAAGAT
jgi:DHA3 family tetracycline resistance protein-like MFS transporter